MLNTSQVVLPDTLVAQLIGRFDDKTFAALVLESGEALEPVPIPRPNEPFHIHALYPFSNNIDVLSSQLIQNNHPNQILHIYYKPDNIHGVYKIELNIGFLSQTNIMGNLFSWWCREIDAPDLQEPYSFYIADRFSKEAVSVAKNALKEITQRDVSATSPAWFFMQPYRTP